MPCVTRSGRGASPSSRVAERRRVAPPVARPGKVVCIGLNYRDHAGETGAQPPEPVVFMKDPTTVVGPFDDVLIPRSSTKTDWEVELGVVIGADGALPRRAGDAAALHRAATSSRTTCPSGSSSSSAAASGTRARAARRSTRSAPARHPGRGRRTRRRSDCACRSTACYARTARTADMIFAVAPRDLVPQPVHGAAPGRRHQHGHAGRRRARTTRQAVSARRRRRGARDRRPRPARQRWGSA